MDYDSHFAKLPNERLARIVNDPRDGVDDLARSAAKHELALRGLTAADFDDLDHHTDTLPIMLVAGQRSLTTLMKSSFAPLQIPTSLATDTLDAQDEQEFLGTDRIHVGLSVIILLFGAWQLILSVLSAADWAFTGENVLAQWILLVILPFGLCSLGWGLLVGSVWAYQGYMGFASLFIPVGAAGIYTTLQIYQLSEADYFEDDFLFWLAVQIAALLIFSVFSLTYLSLPRVRHAFGVSTVAVVGFMFIGLVVGFMSAKWLYGAGEGLF